MARANHPSCNGKNEKLNGTLVKCLRKHAEDDPYNWDIYLEFCTFAYNTRQHSVTGYAPYTGVFGIICNNFDNFILTNDEKILYENNIKRIKHLFETIQEEIKQNRNEFQVKQKKVQDSSHQLAKEPFKVGDLVTIKALKIQGKLQPRYNGVFKIDSITSHGNYRLKNDKNEFLKQSFLHSRLKKVPIDVELDEDEHCEVECILKHRTRNKQLQYLVKWKDTDEQTWEPEYHFDTTECIEEYWQKLNKPVPSNQILMCLTTFAKIFKYLGHSHLSIFLLFCCVFVTDSQIIIKEQFKFCDVQSKEVWDLPESCKQFTPETARLNNNFHVLSKKQNEFDGMGTACSKKIISVQTYINFLGSRTFIKNEEIVDLSKEECELMVTTKRCDRQLMSCNEGYCSNEFKPNIEYSWLNTVHTTWPECNLYSKRLVAPSLKSKILITEHTFSSCTPLDLYCKLQTSTIVWDQRLIDKCPYGFIRTINLDVFGSVLVSDFENKLFQITDETKICENITVYNTAEGFQLTTDPRAFNLQRINNDLKIIDNLLLTEIDFNKKQQLELIINIYQSSNTKLCQLYKSIIHLYTKIDDEYFVFSDFNGNDAVIYSDDGQIFIPQCQLINEIKVINSTNNCYKDIPIQIEFNNNTLNVFLTKEKIIRMISKTVNCKDNRQHIYFNNKESIIREANTVWLQKEPIHKTIQFSLQNSNISNINFMVKHDNFIISSINMLNESISILTKNEPIGILHIMEDVHSDSNTTFGLIFNKLLNLNSEISELLHNIMLYVVFMITIAIVIFICTAVCKKNN